MRPYITPTHTSGKTEESTILIKWKWGAGEEKKNHPNADKKKTGPAMFISIK